MSIVLIAFTLVIGPAIMETLTMGRTVGKFAMGIRTVRDDAGPISFHHSFVRHLVGVVEIWVLSGVPALVGALVSSKGKRIGDFAAGTYVVRDRYKLQLPWPVQMPPHLAALGRQRRHRAAARLPGRRAAPAAGPDRHAEPRVAGPARHPHRGPRSSSTSRRHRRPAPTPRTSSPRSRPSAAAATSTGSGARPTCAGG